MSKLQAIILAFVIGILVAAGVAWIAWPRTKPAPTVPWIEQVAGKRYTPGELRKMVELPRGRVTVYAKVASPLQTKAEPGKITLVIEDIQTYTEDKDTRMVVVFEVENGPFSDDFKRWYTQVEPLAHGNFVGELEKVDGVLYLRRAHP